jgi:protein HIRA/HIR1
LRGSGKYLLVITTTGIVSIWDTQTLRTKIASSSIASQFTSSNVGTLSKVDLSDNGSPILAFSGGMTLGWSEGFQAWVRIHEAWWKEGSDVDAPPEQNDGKPKAFRTTLTLGHLETRIAASLMVGSGEQWRGTVVDYARRLVEERYVERAEELIRELAGPVFWYVMTFRLCY